MIGTVTRVTAAGVYVQVTSILPGIELGPLPALVHRYKDDPPSIVTHLTAYAAGDRVMVVEDTPNDFIVTGIVG